MSLVGDVLDFLLSELCEKSLRDDPVSHYHMMLLVVQGGRCLRLPLPDYVYMYVKIYTGHERNQLANSLS